MKDDCLFCQIANGDKKNLIWENDVAAAFNDIHPKAPVHVLVVPKVHIDSLDDLSDSKTAGELLLAVQSVAEHLDVAGGYRVMINVGRSGGQLIDHLHVHIMAGKHFSD